MSDIREDIVLCINLDKTRVLYPLDRVVLCGGAINEDTRNPGPNPSFLSFRDVINRQCLQLSPKFAKNLLIAEDFHDWLHHSKVDNLIEFELHLADLASLVVLVLEGPGAYAELGSFSVLDRIARKLIVVSNEKLIPENSFIRLGPMRYLEKTYPGNVLELDWDVEYRVCPAGQSISSKLKANDIASAKHIRLADDCINKIDQVFLEQGPAKIWFHKSNKGHVSLLVSELVHFFHGLKIREIQKYLGAFEIDIREKQLKEMLYILEKLCLVRCFKYLNDKYYIAGSDYVDRFSFSYDDDAEWILPDKNKILLRDDIKKQYAASDEIRYRALGFQ